MANTTLTQTGAQVQADLDKVEGLANIKSVGSGLSLSSAGQLSASGGSGGVTEISTQYIRITNLSAGVYKLTYNGTKYIYYNGSTGTSTHTVGSGSGAVILTVAKYNSSYWTWHYIGGSTTPTIYYGYTSSSSGSVYNDALADANTNYYPSRSYTSGLQISSYVGSSSCALYVPHATDSQYGVIKTSAMKDTLTWDGHIFNILDNPNVELSYYGHASYTPHTGRLHFNGVFMVRNSNSEGDNIFSFQISNLTSAMGWDIPYNFTRYPTVGANYWLGTATYGAASVNANLEGHGGIVGFYNGGTGVKHICLARLFDEAGGQIGPWPMSALYGVAVQVNFELFCD